jgi:hypothetical protein
MGFKQQFVDAYWAARNASENKTQAQQQAPAQPPPPPQQPAQPTDVSGVYDPPAYVPRLYQPPTYVPSGFPMNWQAARAFGYVPSYPYSAYYGTGPWPYAYDNQGPYYYRSEPVIIIQSGGKTFGTGGKTGFHPAPGFNKSMQPIHPAPYINNSQVHKAH